MRLTSNSPTRIRAVNNKKRNSAKGSGTPQIREPGIAKQLLKIAGFKAVRFTRFEVIGYDDFGLPR
jgi:hypothetical protein